MAAIFRTFTAVSCRYRISSVVGHFDSKCCTTFSPGASVNVSKGLDPCCQMGF